MDKKWIELVKKRLCLPAYEAQDELDELWWTMPKELLDDVLEDTAKDIAQAHEQDKTDAMHTQFLADQAAIVAAQAQVAMMAEAIRLFDELVDHETGEAYKSDWLRIEIAIEKALQSAPKVLYAGDAGWDTETHENNEPVLWLALEDTIHLGRTPGPITKEDGTLAKVIVLEGPTALQEQSKAIMPDSECLPTSCTYCPDPCPDPVFMPGWKVCARHSGMQHQPNRECSVNEGCSGNREHHEKSEQEESDE